MTPQQPDNRELLSGLLDGALSASEAKRIEAEIRENPALQQELDELIAIRHLLLKGRPKGRLPSSFASRIASAAQSRAAELGVDAPEWIAPEPEALTYRRSPPKLDPPYVQRLVVPAGALLAALGIVLFVAFLPGVQTPGPVANLPPFGHIGNDPSQDPGSGISKDQSLAEAALSRELNPMEDAVASVQNPPEVNVDPNAQMATTEKADGSSSEDRTSDVEVPRDLVAVTPDVDRSPNRIASNAPSMEEKVAENAADATKGAIPSDGALANPANRSMARVETSTAELNGVAKAPFMMMVVSVAVDPLAIQDDVLNGVLRSHGIAAIDDLALSSSELDALLSTGLTGSIQDDGAQVFFLKGYAQNLSGAMEDICRQFRDFPEFGISLTMDDSAKLLVDQLQDIQVVQTKGVAKRLGVKTDNGMVSTFSRGRKAIKPMSEENRENYKSGMAIPSLDANPLSHMMLIVKPAQANNR